MTMKRKLHDVRIVIGEKNQIEVKGRNYDRTRTAKRPSAHSSDGDRSHDGSVGDHNRHGLAGDIMIKLIKRLREKYQGMMKDSEYVSLGQVVSDLYQLELEKRD